MARTWLPAFLRVRPFRADEDPNAAPGARPGCPPARPWSFARGVQNLLWVFAGGLIFLLVALGSIDEGEPGSALVGFRLAALGVIAAGYLLAAWTADSPLWVRWLHVGLFVVVLVLTSAIWPWIWVNFGAYVSVLLAALIPWRWSRWAILLWAVLMASTALLGYDLTAVYLALVSSAVGWWMGGGLEVGRMGAALQRAERRVATLAVAAERERIGRDLHDILGHSLTAIALKSDLAERLLDADPVAARAQLREITEIARRSLADVRTTASGIQEVRLAGEVASARSVLLAAGIESTAPSAVEPRSDADSELLGYVVREAVTNVVRHSAARHCTIEVAATSVVVRDDGRGLPGEPGTGSGLRGLRRRVEAAGGVLSVRSLPAGGTEVAATLPEDPPRAEPAPATRAARGVVQA